MPRGCAEYHMPRTHTEHPHTRAHTQTLFLLLAHSSLIVVTATSRMGMYSNARVAMSHECILLWVQLLCNHPAKSPARENPDAHTRTCQQNTAARAPRRLRILARCLLPCCSFTPLGTFRCTAQLWPLPRTSLQLPGAQSSGPRLAAGAQKAAPTSHDQNPGPRAECGLAGSCLLLVQGSHTRQHLALQQLQRGTTTCGDAGTPGTQLFSFELAAQHEHSAARQSTATNAAGY